MKYTLTCFLSLTLLLVASNHILNAAIIDQTWQFSNPCDKCKDKK